MEVGLATRASTPAGAVFLSYASQDAEAAQRISEALRSALVEVWFDQSELRGGDAWDREIRKQIHDCTLFIPVISAHSDARHEGYFRREWRLAVERAGDMAADVPFLLPVVIDSTPDTSARVPERFREVQWSRLPDGRALPEFVQRVVRLLAYEPSTISRPATTAVPGSAAPIRRPARASWRSPTVWAAAAVLALAVVAYFVADKFWIAKHQASPATLPTEPTGVAQATFAPPPRSIAVLPFVNMSGDKEQEYFSDGLSEELLNSLSRINELQVAARTSSFYFKGEHADLPTIARKLNVASILEGSVRRSGQKVRITAQLNNARTGFHLWSETYDRDLGDVLKVQTEIAEAVAAALRVKLLGGAAEKVELGGTRNPAAFDAYLRGLRLARIANTAERCAAPNKAFGEAIEADPHYALAYASRSLIRWDCATFYTSDWMQQSVISGVRSDAARAIELAPGLAAGHVAMSSLEVGLFNFPVADEACTRALALAPGNDEVLYYCSQLAAWFGRAAAAITLANRGVALDPLNPRSYRALGDVFRFARRYEESVAAYQRSISLDPEHAEYAYAALSISYYLAGSIPAALASCETRPDDRRSLVCKAILYWKLGRRADAEAAMADIGQHEGDSAAYQYAEIHAQWNDRAAALEWLEKARRLGDPGLDYVRSDPLVDPLRKEPRFQAIERALKFPD